MILGILSDTHNDYITIAAALRVMKEHGVKRIIHCGDICSPETIWTFAGNDIHFAYGNMDTDHTGLAHVISDFHFEPISDVLWGECNGKRYAACHGHDHNVIEGILKEGLVDYLFVGHSHRRSLSKVGRTLIVNPGALGGRRPQSRSIAIVNTLSDDIRFYQIPDGQECTPSI